MSRRQVDARDWAAIALAIGVALALNIMVIAVLLDALLSSVPVLSENASQVLTTAFAGVVGVLGGYIGFRAGARSRRDGDDPDDPDEPDTR